MPLQDHFHPPLSQRRQWQSFPYGWSTYLAAALNKRLPAGYFAQPSVEIGIEADVGTLREGEGVTGQLYQPPAVALAVATPVTADRAEVQVFDTHEGPVLVGAVELVSPGNKDRPAERQAFVDRCLAYLYRCVGLVIVDVVTERKANLHSALMNRLGDGTPAVLTSELYATAYRPRRQEGELYVEVWQERLALGEALPTLPLWLGPLCVPVELESAYERTCEELRIGSNGAVHAP
jgi:hypothetical protein